jgi:hypothetical protein
MRRKAKSEQKSVRASCSATFAGLIHTRQRAAVLGAAEVATISSTTPTTQNITNVIAVARFCA